MSGINQSVVFDVCRIKGEFCSEIGNCATPFSGTGFWLRDGDDDYFVTNKHNIDPSIKYGESTELNLYELEIELRFFPDKKVSNKTKWFKFSNPKDFLSHESADAAIIKNPQFEAIASGYRSGRTMKVSNLAEQNFFKDKAKLMDVASFIGFPGKARSQWWDKVWNLGIARTVNIASLPDMSFSHEDLKTSDVLLVSGLSFSGSSGSVVFLHEKSVAVGGDLVNPAHVPPMIIGIMSGHWPEPETPPDMFNHSGLSYLTRSTSIISLNRPGFIGGSTS